MKSEEVDDEKLKIMNNIIDRLANCIVMLKNNIKVLDAIKDFAKELQSHSPSGDIKEWLNQCEQDIVQFDDRMTDIRDVAQAIVDRAMLLMERALRREAGVSSRCTAQTQ